MSALGLLGVEGRGHKEGNLCLWLCPGLSPTPCLPAAPDSLSHKKQGVHGAGLQSPPPLRGACGQGGFTVVPQSAAADIECQRNRVRSDKACWGAGPAPGLLLAAALAAPHPEPHTVLGTTVVDGLPLGNRGGRPRDKGGAAGQSRGNVLPAEGGAASR